MSVPSETELLRAIFDAYPAPTYLVDAELDIVLANRAASVLGGGPAALPRLERAGAVLHCLQVEPSGCGAGAACGRCVIRRALGEALARGAVHRVRAFMQRRDQDTVREVHYLVSAAPLVLGGRSLAVLTLEDVTDIARLKSLLPMCAGCRKIRNDEDYWESVETYLKAQLDVDVSHGFCDACAERLYPEAAASLRRDG